MISTAAHPNPNNKKSRFGLGCGGAEGVAKVMEILKTEFEMAMALGGIPHYLKEIKRGESVAQSIDRFCFDPNGILYDEFSQLYPSLFDNAENHIAIIGVFVLIREKNDSILNFFIALFVFKNARFCSKIHV